MSDEKKPVETQHPPSKGLRYIGGGAALPDIPARDLSADEIDSLAATSGPLLMGHGGRVSFIKALVESGLYKEA
jgi:hypothetical protein